MNNHKHKLAKEEMFNFILENNVEITLDGSVWTKKSISGEASEKIQKKYTVIINGCAMCGFDLEQAIQYYHDNLRV